MLRFSKFVKITHKKNSYETIYMRFLLRPCALILCWILLRFPISANGITLINIMLLTSLIPLSVIQSSVTLMFLLFNLSALLDCMDGIIARARYVLDRKKSNNGEAIDAASGYIFNMVFWLYVFSVVHKSNIDDMFYILVVLTACLSTLPQLIMKKAALKSEVENRNHNSILHKLDTELSFTGFLLHFFVILNANELLEVFVIIYLILYCVQLVYSLVKIFGLNLSIKSG